MGNKRKEKTVVEILKEMGEGAGSFMPLVSGGEGQEAVPVEFPELLPLLPLRNTVLFPGVVIPISVGRKKSQQLILEVNRGARLLGAVAQKDPMLDDPEAADMYPVGTMAEVLKLLEMPDGSTTIIIQGKKRFMIREFVAEEPYFMAEVDPLEEIIPAESNEFKAVVGSLKDLSVRIAHLSSNIPSEAAFTVRNLENSAFLVNFICSNTDIGVENKQKLLEIDDLGERGVQAISYLVKEVQMLELKQDIQSKVKTDIDRQQREYLLHQQMKTIQDELGGNPLEQEIKNLKERAGGKKWNAEAARHFEREVEKLSRLNPAAGEYSVQYGYCQVLLDLPWDEVTEDNFDLLHAKQVLDEDHFGLDKVKDRILEHLAVLKLKNDLKSPILCLYGPPGVGKTSLGKSVARALGRKYVRMSLGGLHDESEIRGHRKTYIGAMPGRILQNIRKARSSNPVFVLDEIDKVARQYNGDPASALLEVLDPEQNAEFHDNYVELEYDLGRVLFIATANTLNTIAPPLRDRLELIEMTGYLVEEKIEIAKRHLVPRQLANHGVKAELLVIPDPVLEYVVEYYTRESGVRELDKKIARIVRRVARKIAFGEPFSRELAVGDIREYLGIAEYNREEYQGNDFAGVVTGLAWTAAGGEILFVESSLSQGKGDLTITGNLGDVMKESAVLALEYLKSHAGELGLEPSLFAGWNVHMHIPEGAIPKDGPSAGVTMVTSLASVFTRRKVKAGIAMTGEITLRGKVLPVGGIKEKILAAKRAGIREILLPEDNRKDLEEINEGYLRGVGFVFVRTIGEVLAYSLMEEKAGTLPGNAVPAG